MNGPNYYHNFCFYAFSAKKNIGSEGFCASIGQTGAVFSQKLLTEDVSLLKKG